ncbi:MAG: GNAT family N-acetyltransferase [Chloroflexota bacterium]|nr:GNAT family N-acetyltransferase [Chloroflexota bacterium]
MKRMTTEAGVIQADSPPPITLRPLIQAQAPDLQAVYEAAQDYFQNMTHQATPKGQAEGDLAQAACDDARHMLGITLEDTLIGVVDLRFADPGPLDARLGLILVSLPYRGQGLASWALRILEAWLSQATPTEAVVLSVLAQNRAAQAFFLHHGYLFTGETTRIMTGVIRSRQLYMRKPLKWHARQLWPAG